MNTLLRLSLIASLSLGALAACGDDSGDTTGAATGALTGPTNLKATTVDGKPHLAWSASAGEDHCMIERMDDSVSSDWVTLKGAEELVPHSNQFHDTSAMAGKTYMYRVVAMKGHMRAVSNEVTWP